MKKKWPFKVPEEYLSMKISDLRKEHGIQVLHVEGNGIRSNRAS